MGGSNFRVIIAGGSIAGLSLALMLEKNGIDFVVLDAYPEIAPNLGASIALRPNGFRIMDQLGCYEDVLKLGQYPVDTFVIHDVNGKPLAGAKDLRRDSVDRYGYPILFFTRREWVQVLYDHIKNKDKVLTSKRVKAVEEKEDKVTVTTQDGAVFDGDLVVGTDGIHSAIRQEIERQSSRPIGIRTENLPALWAGVFGTTASDLQSPKGSVIISSGKGSSLYVAAGPDDITFWMVFFKFDKTYFGRDTPCSKEDAEEYYSKKYWDHPITPNYKYSDLRKDAIVSVCTPLHEYVIDNWHSHRCIILGDSAHKVNPVGAQGGNAAIESSAALANAIVKLLRSNGSGKIPREKFNSALEDVQNLRKPRTTFLCNKSTIFQEICAETNFYRKITNRYIMPLLGKDAMFDDICAGYPSAVSLDMIDIPSRPRACPYFDELIRMPKPRGFVLTGLASTILLALGALGAYLLLGVGEINGTFRLIKSAAEESFLHELNIPLQSLVDADQFPSLDKVCKSMVAAFLPVVSGAADFESKIQSAYFLISVYLPLLSIIALEGYRFNNKRTLLWSPCLWTGLAQALGLGLVFPFYLLAVFFASRGPSYWMPYAQAAPAHKTKALLPGILLGYLSPTVLMHALDARSPLLQPTIALWQASPLLAIALAELFSHAFATPPNPKLANTTTNTVAIRPEPFLHPPPHRAPLDAGPARRLHAAAAAVAGAAHVALLSYVALTPTLSLTTTFMPRGAVDAVAKLSLRQPPAEALEALAALVAAPVPSVAAGIATFFRFDMALVLAAALLWSGLTLHDLRRVGLAERGVGVGSIGLLLAGWVLVGPGAAMALLWRWREGVVGGFVPRRMAVDGGGKEKEAVRKEVKKRETRKAGGVKA